MKKLLVLALALLMAFPLLACAPDADENENANAAATITVVATLFPQYDFARAVAGERASVSLLLPPGVESHSFEPTPADMAAMTKADLILYTGDAMEPWMAQLAEALDTPPVDLSAGVTLDAAHEREEADEHGHAHELDPHIWTDPLQAVVMVENIRAALCKLDPAGTELYTQNAAAYIKELKALDAAISEAVAGFSSHTICFGGRFALHYFAKRYGFDYIAAYDSCSEETEPSARAVADIIDAVRAQDIRAIYYEELTEPTVADSIAAETGIKALLLHSCHNVSKAELAAGATYLSLMYQNLENLKEGLA